MFRHFLTLALVLSFVATLPFTVVGADLTTEVAKDFQPLAGFVVMPVGEEFLIDLDAAKGVHEGDLFAVVKPGEKVVHPITREVIGALDEVKGYLQVTRVKSGYSYAKTLASAKGIERGDRVRRFENLPALFWDYTGQGEGFYTELRTALPNLEWHSYAAAQAERPASPKALPGGAPTLYFVWNENGLGVKDGTFHPLRFYARPLTPASPAPALPLPQTAIPGPALAGTTLVPPAALNTAPAREGAGIIKSGGTSADGIWYGPEAAAEQVALAIGDFDGDGKQETALAYPQRLDIVRLIGTHQVNAATVDLGSRVKVLCLDSADLNGDGRPELYVTAADGQELASLVVEWEAGGYQVVIRNLPWFLRVLDLPGERMVLVGQALGQGRNDFSGGVFRVERSGNTLRQGATLNLPELVSIYGFQPLTGEQGLIVNESPTGTLQVLTPAGEKLWQREGSFGGREGYLERIDTDVVRDVATRNLYLKGNPQVGIRGEVLVPVNEGSNLMANRREYESSRVVAMSWDGRALQELWHTKPQSGYLADFKVADVDNDGTPEIAMSMVFSHGGLFSKSRSSLVVYELQ